MSLIDKVATILEGGVPLVAGASFVAHRWSWSSPSGNLHETAILLVVE